MGYSDSSEVSSDNKLLLDIGLATVFVCGMLLAAFVATAVISREIERKTVLTVVSKPVPRPVVVVGKYLGVAGAMLVAVLTMLLFLLACFGVEVITGLGQAGLVERVLGLAQAVWPLTVVLSCRHPAGMPAGPGRRPNGAGTPVNS